MQYSEFTNEYTSEFLIFNRITPEVGIFKHQIIYHFVDL